MSILEEKIELAKMVLDIEDESLIEQIKSLLAVANDNNIENLPDFVKRDLEKSLEQADAGEFVSYQNVFKEVDALLRA